ncbi:MAG: L,D-transpeptidase [Gemmatimonadaceae bacterium]|nr:L,D-transpeptidase [Gemmatimonadaceae bacterium]
MALGFSAPLAAQDQASIDSASAKAMVAQANLQTTPVSLLTLTASLSTKRITLRQGDSVVAEYDVAIGKEPHPTPSGEFRIKRIVWNPRWVPPDEDWARGKSAREPGHPANPMKVVKIFFMEPDYYIHGTGDIASLGTAASHGCLRMDPDEAAEVAKWVMLHGGKPREEGWFKRILHFRRQEQVVYLDNPVVLTITE